MGRPRHFHFPRFLSKRTLQFPSKPASKNFHRLQKVAKNFRELGLIKELHGTIGEKFPRADLGTTALQRAPCRRAFAVLDHRQLQKAFDIRLHLIALAHKENIIKQMCQKTGIPPAPAGERLATSLVAARQSKRLRPVARAFVAVPLRRRQRPLFPSQ
jgi:hypothetical protein